MLCVRTKNGQEYQWHIGESTRSISKHDSNVVMIQADCDELLHITRKFNNIPTVTGGRVVRWYGDHAKFIAGNL